MNNEYYSPTRMIAFSPFFIEILEDPLHYFFSRYNLLEYIGYFRDNNIDIATIKIMKEDNIMNLDIEPFAKYEIIFLGQMLRQYDMVG